MGPVDPGTLHWREVMNERMLAKAVGSRLLTAGDMSMDGLIWTQLVKTITGGDVVRSRAGTSRLT